MVSTTKVSTDLLSWAENDDLHCKRSFYCRCFGCQLYVKQAKGFTY